MTSEVISFQPSGAISVTDKGFKDLDTAKPAEISIAEEYYEFVPKGEAVRGFALGIETKTLVKKSIDPETGEEIETAKKLRCASFVTSARRIYFNGALKFVDAMSKLKNGGGFEAKCTGTKTVDLPNGEKGKMQLFDVFPIDL